MIYAGDSGEPGEVYTHWIGKRTRFAYGSGETAHIIIRHLSLAIKGFTAIGAGCFADGVGYITCCGCEGAPACNIRRYRVEAPQRCRRPIDYLATQRIPRHKLRGVGSS
jgi:hypothetical protein